MFYQRHPRANANTTENTEDNVWMFFWIYCFPRYFDENYDDSVALSADVRLVSCCWLWYSGSCSIVVFVVVVVVALHPKLSLVARIDGLATRSGLCGSGSESYPATQVQEWAVEERVFD